jgi:exopolyphosphatase/guanosine-5'-triphosphate,3'-diphosphate pyrophosphatase
MIAIDLGSNTIRFIEYNGKTWGKSYEKIVRTAEGLYETGIIGENAIRRIVDAINEAKKEIDFSHSDVIGYTTAAMRLASNNQSALKAIEAETGILFTIIDADKEATLTLNAVRYRLDRLGIEPSSFLLADIGGGSTELIRYECGTVKTVSLNIGIVTLSESSASSAELIKNIELFKAKIKDTVEIHPKTRLVMTAGTPTTIAAYLNGMDYKHYDPDKINGTSLKLNDCYRVYDELMGMDDVARTRYVGVGREKLIMAGILMVNAIYEVLQYHESVIIDDGLREGIALEYFKLH